MTRGTSYAIQILVANELGLTHRGVDFAKLQMQGKLFPLQFSQLELAANYAVEQIQKNNKIKDAELLVEKYFKG
jgi:hypothetical protein